MALVAAIIVGARKCRVKLDGSQKLLPAPPSHNILVSTVTKYLTLTIMSECLDVSAIGYMI